MNLYDTFSYKPKYAKHRLELISKFAYYGGDKGDAVKKQEAAKHFSNVYEFYIYAALLGLTNEHTMSIEDAPRDTFNDMSEWKREYNELGQFLFLSLLAKEDIDLNALEDMEDSEVQKRIVDLRPKFEAYAEGGFDLIATRLREEPEFFDSDYCFVHLLQE